MLQLKSAITDFEFNSFRTIVFYCGLICSLLSSCNSTKNSVYFQNLRKDTTLRNLVSKNYEPKIQKNDLLSITVASLSPDIAFYNAAQNSAGAASASATSAASSPGYLVDESGNIPFVKLGILHVEGMTKKELKDTLERSLIPYLKEAIVSVGFLNRHVTLLGGITPAVLPLAGDNMTVLDALASSGDIGEKGRRDNILVIRERDDNKDFKRLNLTNSSIFYSPYFYLQPNDIIYVEPAKTTAKLTAAQIISYVTSGLSLIILLVTQVFK